MARLIELPGSEPVNDGERAVVAVLLKRLPDSCWIIPNVELAEASGQAFEYDIIVITPHAVYVVETKSWTGRITGDLREWSVNGASRRAPIGLIERKAKILKSQLVEHAPALARVRVQAVVVFDRRPDVLELTPDAEDRVRPTPEALAQYILDPGAIDRRPSEIIDLGEPIVRAITGVTHRRGGPRTFREYRVIEVLEQGAEESLYLAQHSQFPGAPPVRLRVTSLSPYRLTPQQFTERREAVYRELHAQMMMGSHPNIVTARAIFDDEVRPVVVTVLDDIQGRTLRQRLQDGTPLTYHERLDVLVDVCRALAHAHAHRIVHRTVAPDRILIGDDGAVRLTGFGLAKLAVSDGATVWTPDNIDDADPRYLAPELSYAALGDVSSATDLYSLGCVAFELFTGAPPFVGPDEARANAVPAVPGAPGELEALIRQLLAAQPLQRPAGAKDVLGVLAPLRDADGRRPPTGPKDSYGPGELIDGKFEVRACIAGGGFATVYRVYRAVDDREYALKVFNTNVAYDKVQNETRILAQIDHPNIVHAVWADTTRTGQWYIVTDLIEGETLQRYADGEKRFAIDEAVRLIGDLLGALEVIHPKARRIRELKERANAPDGITAEEYDELGDLESRGIVHRDIKPNNVMLTDDGRIVLIDFNISSQAGSPVHTLSGTPPYQAPDLVAGVDRWEVSPDLFAVGVVLYELLCHAHPYPDRQPRTDARPRDPREHRPDLAPALAELLVKACAPYRDERFQTAVEMRAELAAIDPLVVLQAVDARNGLPEELRRLLDGAPPNINPLVGRLLALSSQARRTNRGTRGIDDLALATYVETRLDNRLAESVLAGRHRLVIVTGNAGDGKTAFIQRVEAVALEKGAKHTQNAANGARLTYRGREIVTLYDGSQDEEDRTSDEVLEAFLGPFATGRADGTSVHLAAINEGRLRDFLLSHRDAFDGLARGVITTLDDPLKTEFGDEIVVVNLNLRSVTTGGADSIFSQQLQKIAAGPFWEPCQACDHRTVCPIKHNVDTFRDPTSGPAATERLRTLVDLVRLRRRRHLTMRDVRSLIAHLLFRDRDCTEIPDLLADPDPMAVVDVAYFQGAAGLGVPEGSALERGASLLREVDVALVANPDVDRAIARGRGPRSMAFPERTAGEAMAERIAQAREEAGKGYDADVHRMRRAHDAARRRLFYERADDGWWEMPPYERLRQFQETLAAEDDIAPRDAIRSEVIRAISMSEGAADAALSKGVLWLATRDDNPAGLRSFRRFPESQFTVRAVDMAMPYIETEADRLELLHDSGARLTLDIDLLEVLDRLREGYVPTQDEGRGILINLALFKQQLLAVPTEEVVLIDGSATLRIAIGTPPGRIVLATETP